MMEPSVDVKRAQKVLLNMAVEIAAILEKHSIPYMLAFGTLLGAVRHRGFIPWDDDFDFYLFDDTYTEAIKVLREELTDLFFLEDEFSEPLYFHGWAHVKDLHSETYCSAFPQDGAYSHKGISVDLYRTKRMMLSDLSDYLNNENYLYINRRKDKGLIDENDYRARMNKLELNRANNYLSAGDKDIEVFNLVPYYKRHFVKADDVLPLKRYVFEDHIFWGPHNADSILTDIYGDYMTLPAAEKRRGHYSSIIFFD